MKKAHQVAFPIDALEGKPGDKEDGRLMGVINIMGAHMWCEALPIRQNAEGLYGTYAADPISEDRLQAFQLEFDAPSFQTITIGAIQYVLIIVPCEE